MDNSAKATDPATDQAFIASLVRKVMARLQESQTTCSDSRLVTFETIEKHSGPQLLVPKSAVITPAARDEAHRRGIAIERTIAPSNPTNHTTTGPTCDSITDTENPERAKAVDRQLSRRGVSLGEMRIVLTDSPAREVHDQITRGNRAAMITAIADVERFADELSPTVWVLDMKRLNIPAAVNTAVKIALQGVR